MACLALGTVGTVLMGAFRPARSSGVDLDPTGTSGRHTKTSVNEFKIEIK